MLDFHKRMICIHKAYPILAKGSLEFLWNDHQGLSYGRFSDSEQIIVILNNQDQERDIRVTAWKTGVKPERSNGFSAPDAFLPERVIRKCRKNILQMQGFFR